LSTPARSKLIACFSSDPGGAQVIAAIAEELTQKLNVQIEFVTEPSGYQVHGHRYSVLAQPDETHRWLKSIQADLVLTGTSTRSLLEISAINAAKTINIPVMSIVDHWTSFRARFERDGNLTLPDLIGVIDERGRDIAIKDQIPADKLLLIGQPYWERARLFRPERPRNEFLAEYGIALDRPYLVFLSDCLLEESGGDPEASKRRWGYLETEIAEQVTQIEPIQVSWVIQLHPKELAGKYQSLSKRRSSVTEVKTSKPLELLYHSSGCVGMFTAALAQANALGKPTCRFEPGALQDYLPISTIPRFFNLEELRKEITSWFQPSRQKLTDQNEPLWKTDILIAKLQELLSIRSTRQ
jgi:hypothetical protein